jgi:hypothetical protein
LSVDGGGARSPARRRANLPIGFDFRLSGQLPAGRFFLPVMLAALFHVEQKRQNLLTKQQKRRNI